jgi:hypothetical protein
MVHSGRNPYEPPAAAEWPRPDAVVGYRPTSGLCLTLVVLLSANAVLGGLSFLMDLSEIALLRRMSAGNHTEAEIATNDFASGALALLFLAETLATIVVFAMFLYRSSHNARALGAEAMNFTPGWTVGWFFVPIAYLFKPYQAVKELWQASEPEPQGRWQRTSVPFLLPLWWALWIVSGIASQASMRLGFSGKDDLEHLVFVDQVDLFAQALGVASAIAALLLVRGIQSRQEQRARVIDPALKGGALW